MDSMETEESFDDDMFDLNPIVSEIYGSELPSSYDMRLEYSFTANQTRTSTTIHDPSSSTSSCSPVFALGSASGSPSGQIAYDNMHIIQPWSGHLADSDCVRHELLNNLDDEANPLMSPKIIVDFTIEKKVGGAATTEKKNPEELRSAPGIRNTWQARDHVMAERKRRAKMTQLFINLSKILPGVKKLDKSSLLEDAVKYMKALQDRIRFLEKAQVAIMETSRASTTTDESIPPAIEVRVSDRCVLIKICCKKQEGFVPRIHVEMERMNLSVVDLRIMPFGAIALLHATILAQMGNECCSTKAVQDIANQLEKAFFKNPLHEQSR